MSSAISSDSKQKSIQAYQENRTLAAKLTTCSWQANKHGYAFHRGRCCGGPVFITAENITFTVPPIHRLPQSYGKYQRRRSANAYGGQFTHRHGDRCICPFLRFEGSSVFYCLALASHWCPHLGSGMDSRRLRPVALHRFGIGRRGFPRSIITPDSLYRSCWPEPHGSNICACGELQQRVTLNRRTNEFSFSHKKNKNGSWQVY